MIRALVSIALLIGSAASLRAAEASRSLALFNGRDFDGWTIDGPSEGITQPDGRPVWSVRDGEIVCEGNRWSFLRYERQRFGDFALHVEFVMAPKGNSGVGLRTGPVDMTAVQTTRPSCYAYEIQLLDDAGQPPSPFSSGSLYRYVAPNENAMKPAGEWNTLDVTCRGPVIEVVLNGRKIQHFDQTTLADTVGKPLVGHVCLQNHGHHVRFRNVRIRPLGTDGVE
jgi:hypothetical protein